MIETWDLGKTYRPPFCWPAFARRVRESHALRDVTLQIARGEIFGLVGPNGAGKTTMLRLLATVFPPTAGGGRIGGADLVNEARKVRRAVALASGDERGFYWRLSGRENLEFFAGLRGLAPGASRHRVREVLELVDLSPMADRPAGHYSRGMRQRLGIARALLGAPEVLLLDEPTRSLDPIMASGIQALVGRLAAEHGTTVVLATHDLDEAENICRRVGLLREGRLRAVVEVDGREQRLASWYRSVLAAG
jgi:ABC-2 type transport system ATP-binding protein